MCIPSHLAKVSKKCAVTLNMQSMQKVYSKFHSSLLVFQHEKISFLISGNKSDLTSDREVSTEEGKALAELYGAPFIETSAKFRTNVDEAFHEIVR